MDICEIDKNFAIETNLKKSNIFKKRVALESIIHLRQNQTRGKRPSFFVAFAGCFWSAFIAGKKKSIDKAPLFMMYLKLYIYITHVEDFIL